MDLKTILKKKIEKNHPLENKSLAFSESLFIFGKIEDLESERKRERKTNCSDRIYPSGEIRSEKTCLPIDKEVVVGAGLRMRIR